MNLRHPVKVKSIRSRLQGCEEKFKIRVVMTAMNRTNEPQKSQRGGGGGGGGGPQMANFLIPILIVFL